MGKREIIIPYAPRSAFMPFHQRTERWAVLVCHRRAGKTVSAINDLIKRALLEGGRGSNYAYVAPYRSQAKAVAWDYLKFYSANVTKSTNESELTVELINGAKIRLFGADNADAIRGLGFNGVYLDEYADYKPSVYGSVIRPTLSSTMGWCVFGGTPKGRNNFHAVYKVSQTTPDWFLLRLPASVSKILPESELKAARDQLSTDQYDSEFECSFDAAIMGAYYGQEMRLAQDEGRIRDLKFDPDADVMTAWDLGYRDDTAIWFYQVVRNEIHVLDYYAVSGASIEEIAKVVIDKGYRYTRHYLPHDARAKTLASGGKSIVEQLAVHLGGMNKLSIVPEIGVQDGIQAVRMILPKCYFDPICDEGLEALRQYQREYDEDKKSFRQTPRHDWCSHPADAFRMMAVAYRENKADEPPPKGKTLQTITLDELWDFEQTHKEERI